MYPVWQPSTVKKCPVINVGLGLPVSLKEMNIPDDRLDEMAEKAIKNGPLGNFKKLNQADVLSVLKLAM